MKFLRFLPVLLFAVLLGLFGFTRLMNQSSDQSPLLGQPAPSFFTADILHDNHKFSAATLQKPSLLVFWASWCGICKVDMPVLGRFSAAHDIPLYGIAYHDQVPPLQAAVTGFGQDVQFAALGLDDTGAIATAYGLIGVPTLFALDAQGRVVYVGAGQVSERVLTHDILPLLR